MNTFFFASLWLYSSFLWWCISLDKNMCSKIGFLYNLFKIKRDMLTIWTKIYQISNAVFHFNERKGIKMICMLCLGCSAIFFGNCYKENDFSFCETNNQDQHFNEWLNTITFQQHRLILLSGNFIYQQRFRFNQVLTMTQLVLIL